MKVPSIGDDVYVPTSDYVSLVGGLAKVIGIVGDDSPHYVLVEEHKGASYRWEDGIEPMQDELKLQFGTQRASSAGA